MYELFAEPGPTNKPWSLRDVWGCRHLHGAPGQSIVACALTTLLKEDPADRRELILESFPDIPLSGSEGDI